MAVSKRTRFEVLRRDNYTCRYCRATDQPLTVDHVVPVALGGVDDPSNLVAACRDCNAGKTSSSPDQPLVAQVNEETLRWARAIQLAAERRAEDRQAREDYVAAVDATWTGWHYGDDPDRRVPRDDDWKASVWRFWESGLPLGELLDAIEIAMRKRHVVPAGKWTYMCGIAWSKLREMRDLARTYIEDGEL